MNEEAAKNLLVNDFNVSRETLGDLEVFAKELLTWDKKINLISRASRTEVWERHILDSAQIFRHITENDKKIVDIGSGGGFPGCILAIMAKNTWPNQKYVFVESDQRKAAFLRTLAIRLGLNVEVKAERIEKIEPQNADVMTARALASLEKLLEFAERHLADNGRAIFLKGETAIKEVEEARESWDFKCEQGQSLTSKAASLLTVRNIRRERSNPTE